MLPENETEKVRKLSQQYAYTSIQMHEAVARQAGLSGTDHKYLGIFNGKKQMSAGELAQLTGLTTGAVTGLIDRLEKKNLVRRQFAPNDRRKVFIEPITENIMALLAPLYQEFRKQSAELLATFSNQEMAVLERYFLKINALMRETTAKLNSKEIKTPESK